LRTKITFLLFLVFASTAQASSLRGFEIPRTETLAVHDIDTNRNYEIFIKVPKGYDAPLQKNWKYPVIYLTDAMYTFQIVSGATRYPMNSGKMEDAIIVGISWDSGLSPKASRIRDYTPTTDETWKMKTGEADTHLRFIRNVVFSEVESRYRVNPGRRTYVGNSLGGLFGAYILLQRPEMFQNYILGSPSFWFHNKVIFDLERNYAERNNELDANVFIAVGEHERPEESMGHDLVSDATLFYETIKSRNYAGLNIELRVVEWANHETAFPTTAIQGIYWSLKK